MAVRRTAIPVRVATTADRQAIASTLARAFVDDPVFTYLFPEPSSRPRKLRQFFDLIGRSESDPADTMIAGDVAAATVWRRPGKWRTPTSAMLRHVVPLLATFGTSLARALRLQAAIDDYHPSAPHWYLAFAGCDPALHGRGFGGAAIRAKLAASDADGLPAALETANEANLPIYGALGFAVTGEFDACGLRFWSMWRAPMPLR